MLEQSELPQLIEGLLLSAGKSLSEKEILEVFADAEKPTLNSLRQALHDLQESCGQRGFDLIQVASGYRLQVKQDYAKWVGRLFTEKPPKYSRALLETLALIAYRQPITRGEIEDIRGVSVSTSIFRTLDDRGWIRVVGKRDVPGKPALYATTKEMLDYFGLKSLDELPALPEIMQMEQQSLNLAQDEQAKDDEKQEEIVEEEFSELELEQEEAQAEDLEEDVEFVEEFRD